MPDRSKEASLAVASLLQKDDDALFVELGNRLTALSSAPGFGGEFAPVMPQAFGPVDDLRKFGKKFWEKFNKQAYDLVCGTDESNAALRKQILDAFNAGENAVAAAIAAALASGAFALAPAVAAVIAALVIKLFFKPAHGAMCDLWKEKLPKT